MWWVGSKGGTSVADVYVGTRRVLYVPAGTGQVGSAQAEPPSWSVDGFEDALRVLDGQVLARSESDGTKPIKGWRVWLSAGIARPFLLQVPERASRGEIERIAQDLVEERTGIREECELWVESGRGASVVVVVVVKSHLQELVGRFAKGTGRRLRSLSPWWGEALKAALKRGAGVRLVAIHDCDSLTWLSGQASTFDGVQTLSPVSDRATADAALARTRLALGAEESEVAGFRLGACATSLQARVAPISELGLAPFVECLP